MGEMKRRFVEGRSLRIALLVGVPGFLSGCPNPNVYGTPRTTPVGKVSHTVAAEAFGIAFDSETIDPNTGEVTKERVTATVPMPPTYQIRVGVADRVDVAGRISNMSSIGGDVKWNFYRTPAFDAAIAPGFQWFSVSTSAGDSSASTNVVYVNGPLLLGLNVSEEVSFVLTPGVTYSISDTVVDADDASSGATAHGIWGRAGFGINFRLTEGFAMQPEVTLMKNLSDDEVGSLLYVMGLGFNFGRLPSFADDADDAARAE